MRIHPTQYQLSWFEARINCLDLHNEKSLVGNYHFHLRRIFVGQDCNSGSILDWSDGLIQFLSGIGPRSDSNRIVVRGNPQ